MEMRDDAPYAHASSWSHDLQDDEYDPSWSQPPSVTPPGLHSICDTASGGFRPRLTAVAPLGLKTFPPFSSRTPRSLTVAARFDTRGVSRLLGPRAG